MKKVLLLGAGMVAKPMVDYLIDNDFELTIASRTLSKAAKLLRKRPNGKAVAWTVDKIDELDILIADHDLTVSLLPYAYHVTVAKLCIKHQKHMVTTSYVSEEMKALDKVARDAGILILNEIGVDPGFDHMTAMRIIDKVHKENGKIIKFYSLCGALPAPEEVDNPFGYKFSWSPRGVVLASNNGARYQKEGEVVEIPTADLFKNPMQLDFPEVGMLEVYPNRDSLNYIELYGLEGISTMFRGTFRFPHWCASLDAIKKLKMTSQISLKEGRKKANEILAELNGLETERLSSSVAELLGLDTESPAIKAMEFLGLFNDQNVSQSVQTPFDLTCELMMEKMMLPDDARDMVVMLHSFLVENKNGEKEVVKSRMVDFATEEDTSIARTVALPAAVAVKMILTDQIEARGVQIPVDRKIYEPVLDELEKMGIAMIEEWGLDPEYQF
jgi:saccharopine dehydrogenase-like NADP-dependent oxidoreductase